MPSLPDSPANPADVLPMPSQTPPEDQAAHGGQALDAPEAVEAVDAEAAAELGAPEAGAEPLEASEAAAPASEGTSDQAPAPATGARPADLSPAACAELLKQHFPALFSGAPKPMKLRIQADIQQRVPDVFSKHALGAYFRRYTGSTAYLIALGKATQRFDLDGQPAGELSEEHRVLAREELARRRQITREREQQAHAHQRAEQARLHAQQQAAQAEQWQARQARATLLRDFERTTLTLANFCALKGLTPEALTPQLETARREAAEAPPPRLHDDRRGPGPRRDPRAEPRREARPEGRQDGQTDARPAGPRPDHRLAARPAGRPGGPGGRAGGR